MKPVSPQGMQSPISTNQWGVPQPGMYYPQVEASGNPSWEARNPQFNPSNGGNFQPQMPGRSPMPQGRPWGVALPGQSYIQVEGPGNPYWEARNPLFNPNGGSSPGFQFPRAQMPNQGGKSYIQPVVQRPDGSWYNPYMPGNGGMEQFPTIVPEPRRKGVQTPPNLGMETMPMIIPGSGNGMNPKIPNLGLEKMPRIVPDNRRRKR